MEVRTVGPTIKRTVRIYPTFSQITEWYTSKDSPEKFKPLGLPKSVIQPSISVKYDGLESGFGIKPYISELERDREVSVKIKGEGALTGTLVNISDDAITIVTDKNIIKLRNYDRVESITDGNVLTIVFEESRSKTAQISYLLTGVNWKPQYKILIGSDEELSITLQALIYDNENTLRNLSQINKKYNAVLIAGKFTLPSSEGRRIESQAMLKSAATENNIK